MLRHPLSIIKAGIPVVGLILILSSFTTGSHLNAQTTSGTLMGAVRDKQGTGLSETKITLAPGKALLAASKTLPFKVAVSSVKSGNFMTFF